MLQVRSDKIFIVVKVMMMMMTTTTMTTTTTTAISSSDNQPVILTGDGWQPCPGLLSFGARAGGGRKGKDRLKSEPHRPYVLLY